MPDFIICFPFNEVSVCWGFKNISLDVMENRATGFCARRYINCNLTILSITFPGPSLPMATVDIKNPEINSVQRFHNNSQVNNIVHSSFPKREKKGGKGKRKRLTKADIGTPSNFQWVASTDISCVCLRVWTMSYCLLWNPKTVFTKYSRGCFGLKSSFYSTTPLTVCGIGDKTNMELM